MNLKKPQIVDTIISPEWLIPVQGYEAVLYDHSVIVDKGIIIDILANAEVTNTYKSNNHFNLVGQALVPGFINSHSHAAMNLFKGLADDLPLMLWLQNHIWPAEQKWLSEEFCQAGLELAIAEMLKSGISCFNDMYLYPNVTARVAHQYGIRAMVGIFTVDHATAWGTGPDDYLHKGLQIRDDYKHKELIQFSFAPHAPYTISDKPLEKLATISNELSIPFHIHLHETEQEVKDSIKTHGKRPLQRFNELGLVTPNLMAVHMTQLKPAEITLIGKSGAHIVHCPQSNMKLASGICPVQELLSHDINVALGTDGCASNNDINMLSEMKTAALLGKIFSRSAQSCSASDILYSATLGGAKAMGLEDLCGSIEKGKSADLCAINLTTLSSQPLYDPISQIVYTAGREQISHLWIAGKLKVNNYNLTGFDESELLKKAQYWQSKIQSV